MKPSDSAAQSGVSGAHGAADSRYWQRSRRLSLGLLLVWALLSFGGTYFARDLSFTFFGWPFSYWLAAQGAVLVYCGLIAYYAWAMRRLDEAHEDQARKDSISAANASG